MDFLYSFYVRRLFLSQQIAWILKKKEEENKKTEFPYCLHSDGNIDYFVDYLNNIFFFSFFHIDWYIWFLFFVKWLTNLFIKGCNCFFFCLFKPSTIRLFHILWEINWIFFIRIYASWNKFSVTFKYKYFIVNVQ